MKNIKTRLLLIPMFASVLLLFGCKANFDNCYSVPDNMESVDQDTGLYISLQTKENLKYIKSIEEDYKNTRSNEYYRGTIFETSENNDLREGHYKKTFYNNYIYTSIGDNKIILEKYGQKQTLIGTYTEINYAKKSTDASNPETYERIRHHEGEITGRVENKVTNYTRQEDSVFATSETELETKWEQLVVSSISSPDFKKENFYKFNNDYVYYDVKTLDIEMSNPMDDYVEESNPLTTTQKDEIIVYITKDKNLGYLISSYATRSVTTIDVDFYKNKLDKSIILEEKKEAYIYSYKNNGNYKKSLNYEIEEIGYHQIVCSSFDYPDGKLYSERNISLDRAFSSEYDESYFIYEGVMRFTPGLDYAFYDYRNTETTENLEQFKWKDITKLNEPYRGLFVEGINGRIHVTSTVFVFVRLIFDKDMNLIEFAVDALYDVW